MLIKTTKAAASSDEAESSHQSKPVYRKIGAGKCGVVFSTEKDEPLAYKFERNPDGALWNDYQMHTRIRDAFTKWEGLNLGVSIPDCRLYIGNIDGDKDNDRGIADHFLSQHPGLREAVEPLCNLPSNCLVSQRILPVSERIRNGLIEQFIARRSQKSTREHPENKDCLMRVYFGAEQKSVSPRFSSLRNFKLHCNKMAATNIDVEHLARKVARALAVMHWEAETDARDVEFVLGSTEGSVGENVTPSQGEAAVGEYPYHDLFGEATAFWVLDFNQVRRITLDAAGVAAALDAVRDNDPYFPWPRSPSVDHGAWRAWVAFSIEYRRVSTLILQDKTGVEESDLPDLFIKGLLVIQSSRMTRQYGMESLETFESSSMF